MRRALLVASGILAALVLALVLYAAWMLHRLDTPEFKAAVLARTRTALGADVRVTKMRVSVLSGLTLEGITVGNPTGFSGDLLSASSFALRYRLWPLLQGRLEVSRAAFVKPQLNLSMDSRGRFNYEGLGAPGGRTVAPPASARTARGSALPVEIHLRSLTVDRGAIVMKDAARALLMRADGVNLDSHFEVTSGGLAGAGKARVDRLNLGDMLLVEDLSSPLRTLRDALELSPVRGTVAGGSLSGRASVSLKDFRYASTLKLEGADVTKLLQQAHSAAALAGTLRADANVQGSGGVTTLRGGGKVQVADCRVSNARVLLLLSRVLQLPDLANPDLDQCLAEFTLGGGRLQTPLIRLSGRQLQLTGSGTMNLVSRALDYRMRLALAQPLLNKVTVRELRAAFVDRGDGFSTVDFTITGTSEEPHTNLAETVGKAAAIETLKDRLGRFLGRHKK